MQPLPRDRSSPTTRGATSADSSWWRAVLGGAVAVPTYLLLSTLLRADGGTTLEPPPIGALFWYQAWAGALAGAAGGLAFHIVRPWAHHRGLGMRFIAGMAVVAIALVIAQLISAIRGRAAFESAGMGFWASFLLTSVIFGFALAAMRPLWGLPSEEPDR